MLIQSGLTPTIGGTTVTGTLYFSLGTNHNTCYISPDFASIRFFVSEGSNFANFNLKLNADYTYTEGDENKLVCLNEGYVTYYDAESKSFRIKQA